MTQKQQQFDKKTRDDLSQNGWASQSQQIPQDALPAQCLIQKLSPQQLKHLKDHHHDVVERFQNAMASRDRVPAPLPLQPAVDHWPVVAAKPFETAPSASLWGASAAQVSAVPAAFGKDSILSSFGQRKPPTSNAPSLQSFLNGQQFVAAMHPNSLSHAACRFRAQLACSPQGVRHSGSNHQSSRYPRVHGQISAKLFIAALCACLCTVVRHRFFCVWYQHEQEQRISRQRRDCVLESKIHDVLQSHVHVVCWSRRNAVIAGQLLASAQTHCGRAFYWKVNAQDQNATMYI